MKTLIINCGHAALDNGAIGPINKMFAIAAVADTAILNGQYYGDDRMEVSEENLPTVIELLEESCLLYRFSDDPFVWRGVKDKSEFDQRQQEWHRMCKQ